MPWSAEQWRQQRALKRDQKPGYDKDDPFYHPRFVRAGQQLTTMMRVPMLEWPADLYQDVTGTMTVAGQGIGEKPRIDGAKCACGCGFNHNHAVSALEGEQRSRRVIWFRSMRCKASYQELVS
jgi:hypothetical protein